MQDTYTLARPYAVAAFRQAQEQGALDGWSGALQTLGVIVSEQSVRSIAGNPKITNETLTKLLLDIGGAQFFDAARNFVRVLVDAERLLLAPQVSELFDRLKFDAEGAAHVTVETAFELSDKDRKSIADALRKHFTRTVTMDVTLDEALIGGVIVRAGDKVMDASVRGQLEQLALRLES